MGSCCIQLAVASGATVITTASPSNFDYCKKLGASKCFDYHDDDVEDQIVDALKGKTTLGAYHAVGADGAVETCARIVDRAKGKAIVVSVRGIPDEGIPDSVRTKASKCHQSFCAMKQSIDLEISRIWRDIRQRRWAIHLAEVLAQGT